MEKSITKSSTPGKSGTKSPPIEKSGINISQDNDKVNESMVPGSNPDSNDESYAVNFGNF